MKIIENPTLRVQKSFLKTLFFSTLLTLSYSFISGQTCLDLPPMDGTPAVGAAPPGFTVFQPSPDIINGNGPWPGGGFTVSNVDGSSTSGGTMGLFLSASTPPQNPDGFWESWQTTLTGLTPATSYQVAVEWQQASLDPGMYSGMMLRMGVQGINYMNYTSNGGLDDTWQPATYTFTATSSTHNFVLGIAESDVGSGAIVIDSGDACSIVEEEVPIPTLSEWGYIVLLLSFLIIGSVAFINRRKFNVKFS